MPLRFATNPQRNKLTNMATIISNLNIVVDKMHFAGHIDTWCHANCNPHSFEELKEVIKHIVQVLILPIIVCRLTQRYVSKRSRGYPGILAFLDT